MKERETEELDRLFVKLKNDDTHKHAVFIFLCQSGALSIVTYLHVTGFFDSRGDVFHVGKYVDLFLNYGVFPVAWLIISVQAWQVYKVEIKRLLCKCYAILRS